MTRINIGVEKHAPRRRYKKQGNRKRINNDIKTGGMKTGDSAPLSKAR